MINILLQHENIIIRNATIADAPTLASWWNDGQIMAHAGFPNGIGTTETIIAESISNDTDVTKRRLIIEYNNLPIGELSYSNKGNKISEIGIKICDLNFQNKGIGKIILSLLIKELFEMGYIKIILDTDNQNTRAIHVYETLGFKKIRTNLNSWTNQMGEIRSSVDFELTPNNFKTYLN